MLAMVWTKGSLMPCWIRWGRGVALKTGRGENVSRGGAACWEKLRAGFVRIDVSQESIGSDVHVCVEADLGWGE